MPVIQHKQWIQASRDVCFDLARGVEVHTKTTAETKEKAVGGVTQGLLEEGDMVTWEVVHFGIKQRSTAKVIQMEKPVQFVDVMVKGAFRSLHHTHQFVEEKEGTLMIDRLEYTSPFGPIGRLADHVFLEKYMRNFIVSRAQKLKNRAENNN
ncbi:SRPBCC family protein [Salibacterium aidingense]|uniref:SRPBCC family protein n=1 Tax=Salibacterium aidingense TaxID=384933 RepID=UPI0003FDAB5F|nr:SRPBCC family protein [Salibacterium aidingense]